MELRMQQYEMNRVCIYTKNTRVVIEVDIKEQEKDERTEVSGC